MRKEFWREQFNHYKIHLPVDAAIESANKALAAFDKIGKFYVCYDNNSNRYPYGIDMEYPQPEDGFSTKEQAEKFLIKRCKDLGYNKKDYTIINA